MDQTEQNFIDDLFGKLAAAERSSGPRDRDAENYIQHLISRQPAAPYYMAQTIIVQEQALKNAQDKIAELEAQLAERPAAGGGSFLGGLLGGGRPAGSVPPAGSRYPAQPPQREMEESPVAQYQRERGGGGFLAGAMQTAAGVAGGVMLGNLLTGMFGGGHGAQAKEGHAEAGKEAGDKDAGDKQEAADQKDQNGADHNDHLQDAAYEGDDDFFGGFGADSFDV